MYAALGLASHRALHTNAFDLSVFDYALWTTANGGPIAYVPMFRHSLFAQHFMPTLLLFAPLARVFDAAAYLIVLQALFHAAAGSLLYRFAVRHVSPLMALALTAAFLFSRRSYGAVTSVFYIESLVPLLVFGALLAWESRRLVAYWVLIALALGCKEDVALYVAAFGVVIAIVRRERALGLATTAVALVWLGIAVGIAIPHWRGLYDLDPANPFIEGRYSAPPIELAQRVISLRSLGRIVTVVSATGFLCLLAPAWCAIVAPALVVNLAAAPDSLQAALLGHYLWPILPWLFVAAVFGGSSGSRRERRQQVNNGGTEDPREDPKALSVAPLRRVPSARPVALPIAIVLIALIDTPLPRAVYRAPWRQPGDAGTVLAQLETIPAHVSVRAQPNLIPHLPRRLDMHALGVYTAGQPTGLYTMLTRVGDLWPYDSRSIGEQIDKLAADPLYERVSGGPLEAFMTPIPLGGEAAGSLR